MIMLILEVAAAVYWGPAACLTYVVFHFSPHNNPVEICLDPASGDTELGLREVKWLFPGLPSYYIVVLGLTSLHSQDIALC